MNLQQLKKFAIDHRVEIKFGAPNTSHECLINNKGLVKIPGDNKDFRVEGALEASQRFVILKGESTRDLTREEMERVISESQGKGKADATHDEDE
ncbi:MAG: hypothetical protein L0220_10290 [Acidobacteria bacterium]|nr:hypothetical protein [Acidobacteriota bacterium]